MRSKILAIILLSGLSMSGFGQISFPVKRQENPEFWKRDGWAAIDKAKNEKPRKGKAKNVILFIGDGMGVSTLTASRIFEGQMHGESGEENRLSFEQFPYSALSKTYSANQQTSDSAPTMAGIVTGLKTDEGVLSIDQNVVRGNYKTAAGNQAKTILEMAEESGRSTGVVSTARITHATPGACYSHTPDRDWEADNDILIRKKDAYDAGFPDIARQLIEFKTGDGLEVALGGGRTKFLPKEIADPESANLTGERRDKRDLTQEWLKKPNSAYVWNKAQFDAIDPKKTKHLLGLFQPSHMQFETDRAKDKAGEPSLAEMTTKAIDILSQNKNGYFLMVEGGRIDHAHHLGNAFRALRDTVALSDAVRAASQKVNLDDTLIIVTADHSHTLTIAGYPARGNNILGLVHEVDDDGNVEAAPKLDRDKKPYTTLGYANGPGNKGNPDRPVLTQEQVTNPDYLQSSGVPLIDETHGGEDVAIFATGVNAYLIRGSMEENWIFYVMADALRLRP